MMQMKSQLAVSSVFHPVQQLFGIEGRVVAVLIENPTAELTKKDLQRLANISQTFLSRYYKELKEAGVIKVTRKIGKVEFFMPNLDNEIMHLLEQWYLEKMKESELEDARMKYEKYYKGKETAEDKALVELYILYERTGSIDSNKMKKQILESLEKRGFILSKDGKIYFTQRGHEIAQSLLEYNKEVSMAC